MNWYRRQWEKLGETDPYWAVLTFADKKRGRWDSDAFFGTGEAELQNVFSKLEQKSVGVRFETALDFGCGVGRLSRALSFRFRDVIAIDISQSMLKEARAANRTYSNIRFLHNDRLNLELLDSGSVDFTYSNIVLQHMPASYQLCFIREFARVSRVGGVVVFQAPARRDLTTVFGWVHLIAGNQLVGLLRRALDRKEGRMEIHTLSKSRTLASLRREGLETIEVERYDATGRGFVSYRYYAVKQQSMFRS